MPEAPKTDLDLAAIGKIIDRAKRVAKDYRKLTGRPLGITGEVAEYEASRILNLRLTEARQPGHDATRADGAKIQIKGRIVLEGSKRGQRVGSIRLDHDWDAAVLVLLNSDFEPIAIYEAQRSDVEEALRVPGSRARNERGALAVRKFQSIARLVWSRDSENSPT